MTTEKTILAGGCFWGMEELIRALPGIIGTRVGYTGGQTDNPTYKDVSTGKTGHAEAIEIIFDNDIVTYEQILRFFFQIHDPTTENRQGNDRGTQYRSAIFYFTEDQQRTAHAVITAVEQSGNWPGPLVTELVPAGKFFVAEDHHQDYLMKNPGGYTCHWARPDWVA
ncbi:MAG: peptide-methionine (S)-S-oxide reductase MsrA [Alphaproteobacteria bacterium]|nr:peptide-methionine (S)-S-oxide reductase MsrA [Alphaproteobacteria bacterium]MBU0859093.1 peptide-methionine (S)-S-oxide reductase MsrA [Alphaproteobacteria bacterium]